MVLLLPSLGGQNDKIYRGWILRNINGTLIENNIKQLNSSLSNLRENGFLHHGANTKKQHIKQRIAKMKAPISTIATTQRLSLNAVVKA